MKMNTKKLHVVRVSFQNGVRGLPVVNEKNKILAGGAFEHEEDAKTAIDLLANLLARLGLTGRPIPKTPLIDLDTFLAKVDEEAAPRDITGENSNE